MSVGSPAKFQVGDAVDCYWRNAGIHDRRALIAEVRKDDCYLLRFVDGRIFVALEETLEPARPPLKIDDQVCLKDHTRRGGRVVRGEVSNDATVAVVWPNGDDQMVYARDLEIDSRLTVIAYQKKMSGVQHEIWWGLTFTEVAERIGRRLAESARFSWTFLVAFGAEEPRDLSEFTTLQRAARKAQREQEAKRFAVEAASARDRARVQIDEVLRADPELLDELLACRAKNAKITT